MSFYTVPYKCEMKCLPSVKNGQDVTLKGTVITKPHVRSGTWIPLKVSEDPSAEMCSNHCVPLQLSLLKCQECSGTLNRLQYPSAELGSEA